MTPKELLREIKSRHESLYDRYYCTEKYHFNENNKFLYDDLEQALNELEALKKPPTVDELCKALSEHYKEQVSYSNERHNHLFYFEKSRLGIVLLRHGNIDFYQSDYHKTNYLPPHLITLIGRFYEGLEVKE